MAGSMRTTCQRRAASSPSTCTLLRTRSALAHLKTSVRLQRSVGFGSRRCGTPPSLKAFFVPPIEGARAESRSARPASRRWSVCRCWQVWSRLTPSSVAPAARAPHKLNEIAVSRREISSGLTHFSGLSCSYALKALNANKIGERCQSTAAGAIICATARKSLILNGEMLERSIRHAWK
jgi:hypothetical protein